MNDSVRVTEIYRVFDGDMRRGEIDNRNNPRKSHGLVYFLTGEVKYEFSDRSFTASKGSVVYLPAGGCYFMKIRERSAFICLDFDLLSDTLGVTGEVYRGLSPAVSEKFEQMLSCWYKREVSCLADILSACYRVISLCIQSVNKRYARSEALSRATAVILSEFTSHTLTVRDVAARSGVSEAHLRRIFRAELGISPMSYVNHLRFERSKNLLRESNITVAEISRISGFSDPYYFSREFKHRFGVNPTEYKSLKCGDDI